MEPVMLRSSAIPLATSSIVETAEFYTSHLRFSILGYNYDESGKYMWVALERDMVLLNFYRLHAGAKIQPLRSIAHGVSGEVVPDVAINVESLALMRRELVSARIVPIEETDNEIMKRIVIEDNNGYAIAFFE